MERVTGEHESNVTTKTKVFHEVAGGAKFLEETGTFRDGELIWVREVFYHVLNGNKSKEFEGTIKRGRPNGRGKITHYDEDGNVEIECKGIFASSESNPSLPYLCYIPRNRGLLDRMNVDVWEVGEPGPNMDGEIIFYDKNGKKRLEQTGRFEYDELKHGVARFYDENGRETRSVRKGREQGIF